MRNRAGITKQTFAVGCFFLVAGCGAEEPHLAMESGMQAMRSHRAVLGVGVDYAETKTFRRCVTTPQTSAPHAFEKRLYIEKSVGNRTELDSSMSIDASASAKGFWGSGSASASYFKDVHMNADAFYWLVFADYKLRDEGIDLGAPDFRLTPEALAILNGPRGLAGFYEACGEYFYSGNALGAKYALLYEFKSSEEQTIDKIRAGASYKGFGVEAKASFEKLTTMAQKASVLDVHVEATGGGDSLRSYATCPEQLEMELARLRDDLYVRGLGVATQWYLSDYNMFPEVQEAKSREQGDRSAEALGADLLAKDTALETLYRLYHRNVDYHERLRALQENATSFEPLYGYGAAGVQEMEERIAVLEAGNISIAQAARACIVGPVEGCGTDALTRQFAFTAGSVRRDFPALEDYTGLNGWSLGFMQDREFPEDLHLVGEGPSDQPEAFAVFNTNHKVAENYAGVYAPADRGLQHATVIGKSQMVRDPQHNQMRPYLCVYEYAGRCSLRIVPLGKAPHLPGHVKLQLVMFDDYGFVAERFDFPKRN